MRLGFLQAGQTRCIAWNVARETRSERVALLHSNRLVFSATETRILKQQVDEREVPMPREFSRRRRVGELIQRELAQLIRKELSDPRVAGTTVSEVHLSRDMAYADVLVTRLGAQREESQQAVDALNHAGGYLRGLLGHELRLRAVPILRFHYDESFERSARVSRLIDVALTEDKARHRD